MAGVRSAEKGAEPPYSRGPGKVRSPAGAWENVARSAQFTERPSASSQEPLPEEDVEGGGNATKVLHPHYALESADDGA